MRRRLTAVKESEPEQNEVQNENGNSKRTDWSESREFDELRRRYLDKDSVSGVRVNLMKPFYGKDELPKAQYKEKTVNGNTVQTFISYGEPRFFVNRSEIIMVFRGRHKVERRLFTRILDNVRDNERGKILRAELQKAKIPGA